MYGVLVFWSTHNRVKCGFPRADRYPNRYELFALMFPFLPLCPLVYKLVTSMYTINILGDHETIRLYEGRW